MADITKKIFAAFLGFTLLICAPVYVARAESEGQYFYRVENASAVITGMDGTAGGEIIIPSSLGGMPVSAVDDWAFENNREITGVTVFEGVVKIGDGAFAGCRNLKSVNLPNTVTLVGWDAFWNCSALESIIIPDSVNTIGGFAFSGCTSLKSVKIGAGVSKIGFNAFENCRQITDVYYPLGKTERAAINAPVGGIIKTAIWHYNNSETGIIPGDINGDGKVNNKDLTRLFQNLSKWDVAVNKPALDVNGDGKINNKDLTRLFQYLSNWKVSIF